MPFVLKPYSRYRPLIWQRVLVWGVVTTLVLVCLIYGFFYALTTPYLIPQFAAPIIILAGITIWALPDLKTAPTRTLEFLFFAYVAAAILWPNYIAFNPPGLPWITMIRLVGFPCAFILLLCVSVSKDFRRQTLGSMRAIPWLTPLYVSFLVVQAVSIGFSSTVGASLNLWVDAQINWTMMFFVSCYVFLKPGNAERWAVLLWAGAIVLSVLGFWEARLEHVPWAGHIPSFLKVDADYVENVLSGARRLGTDKYRLQGTHSTSLGLSEYLALTSPFVIHFMVDRAYPRAVRLLAALSLPLIFYTIVGTDARLGSVGFVVGCLLYLMSWAFLQWRQVKSSILGPAFVFGAPIFSAAFLAATLFIGRLHLIVWGGGNDRYSTQGRTDQYHMGIPKVMHHPWGYGIGRGAEELNYRNLGGGLTIDTYYLLVALDYGIIGFLLYYSALLLSAGFAVKVGHFEMPREREHTILVPTAVSLVVFTVTKSVFSQTENHYLQFIMMGLACALIYRIHSWPADKASTYNAGPAGPAPGAGRRRIGPA